MTEETTTAAVDEFKTVRGKVQSAWKIGIYGAPSVGKSELANKAPGSFFIDLDDYAHLVYKDRFDGYIYYRRGTPNAGRTAWTWRHASRLCPAPSTCTCRCGRRAATSCASSPGTCRT